MSINAAARKIQEAFRRKLIFTNNKGEYKVSKAVLTAQIVSFKLPTLWARVFESEPKGFSEIMGYASASKAPVVRWTKEHGPSRWVGEVNKVTKLVARYRNVTIVLTNKGFDVLGAGNYEQALLAIVKSGWAPKILMKAPPTYKKIDGMFNVNRRFNMEKVESEFNKIPGATARYAPEFGVKAVIVKLNKPKWTYQIFENGTVLFTGIKTPKDIDFPRELFTQYLFMLDRAVFQGGRAMLLKPRKNAGAAARARAANRYPLVASWNTVPPLGYYVRPGQNNKPRLYMWAKMERRRELPYPVQVGYLKLTAKNAATVARRYKEVGVEPPPATKQVFKELGIPLPTQNLEKRAANRAERSEWNFVDPAGKRYVRPGPGHQPRVYDVPKDKKAGAKTVIKAYAAAKRNIPAAVRTLFGIGGNVKTANNAAPKHRIEMGLNKILRINGKQATRIPVGELLAIARNLDIAQVNAKSSKATLIGYIQGRTGATRANRSADALVDGIYYKFLNNGKVRRVTEEGVATEREWATLGPQIRQKIAQKVLSPNLFKEYNSLNLSERFNAIRAVLFGKKERANKAAANKAVANKAAANKAAANKAVANAKAAAEEEARKNAEVEAFMNQAQYNLRLTQNLGNAKNLPNLLKVVNALPKGARGKPLKQAVDRAYDAFLKNVKLKREKNAYLKAIQVPNWLPATKVTAYKSLVMNLAFKLPRPKAEAFTKAIKKWLSETVPQSPARAARQVENAITGQKRIIPAYVPKKRASPVLPAVPAGPRKVQRASPNRRLNYVYAIPRNAVNLSNTLESLGINTTKNMTWNEIRAALKGKVKPAQIKKLQEQWKKNVMNKIKLGRVGPLKRKVQKKPTAK